MHEDKGHVAIIASFAIFIFCAIILVPSAAISGWFISTKVLSAIATDALHPRIEKVNKGLDIFSIQESQAASIESALNAVRYKDSNEIRSSMPNEIAERSGVRVAGITTEIVDAEGKTFSSSMASQDTRLVRATLNCAMLSSSFADFMSTLETTKRFWFIESFDVEDENGSVKMLSEIIDKGNVSAMPIFNTKIEEISKLAETMLKVNVKIITLIGS